MPNFGMGELAIIFAIVVLLFGAKRLPDLATGLGKSIRNFKKGISEEAVEPTETALPEQSSGQTLRQAENAQSQKDTVNS